MSKVSVLREKFEGTVWKVAFAEALIRLCPGINPDAADEASDTEVVDSKGVDPSIAAMRWAMRNGFVESPSQSHQG